MMQAAATMPRLRLEDFAEWMEARGFERVETHISSVFLGADEVYKIKKPVDLGFLDFSTLDKRREACRAEVELNRRLAPEAYLGALPVVLTDDGFRFGGEGDPVEWAVHMRRLPDEDRADVLLRSGKLTPDHIRSLAQHLADFHRSSTSDAHIASFGSRAVIEGNVRENFEQTRSLITRYVDADVASEIESWQLDILEARSDLFSERLQRGRVRDGHGDLRLEHIYFEGGAADGRLAILDCIEFNERFRYADVCADMAFVATDLAACGRSDLSERFLADWAHFSNDFEFFPAVDFYESYRAFVRGKVLAMTEALGVHDVKTREELRSEARRHFLLAQASERRPLAQAQLLAVGGGIASGKSSVAGWLGEQLNCPVVSSDWTRKWLLGREPLEQAGEEPFEGGYSAAATARVYREVLERAARVLESGRSVVVDASFRTRISRSLLRRLASERGLEFHFIECRASEPTCRERLQQRHQAESVSEGRLEVFDAFLQSWEEVRELPPAQHVILDADRSLEETISQLRHSESLGD
ncbi:MAG: AAA family ATPase, partial [Acidobacteriota bacterium]